ncbi:MAG: HDIG domain-containing metalloprotein [Planctomycetota bacterium]
MPSQNQFKSRSDHVAKLDIGPSRLALAWERVRRPSTLSRLAICGFAALLMWLVTGGWRPPFPWRLYHAPSRDVVARTSFEVLDLNRTKEAQESARENVECVYDHDVEPLANQRAGLKDRIFQVLRVEVISDLDPGLWDEFYLEERTTATTTQRLADFTTFRNAFEADPGLERFEEQLKLAFADFDRFGFLESLQHEVDEGNQTEITVRRLADGKETPRVPIEQVRLAEATGVLHERLLEEIDNPLVAERVFEWLEPNLPTTLKLNAELTAQSREQAVAGVAPSTKAYVSGEDVLAKGGKALNEDELELLTTEHNARIASLTWGDTFLRALASGGLYIALYLLCGVYIHFRMPELITDLRRLIMMQGLLVVTITLVRLCASKSMPAELVPLMLFGMTAALAYRQEVALLLSAAVCIVTVLALGYGLAHFVVYAATLAAAILLLRNVRSRTKLIYIGLAAGAVAMTTSLGVQIVMGAELNGELFIEALWHALFALLAGVLMTGLLPFVEGMMDVQTEISLLELGDVAHPLLQELVRRAPGTYSHSISVASIAEAAAESIGANGLLVRVGAYFHDIGKMLKPQYFIENQNDGNRHEALLPAMSTLVIIAHVKDGADLARQHHLPQSIIDFILQHHGTTLVEYFYDQANKQSEQDPDAAEVDEGSYRYPGPKPRTKEAAVLMLADAVESASRTLQDPAPARIESLVHDIAIKRLMDGQFDQCGLTLKELRQIEDSLVKSITAMYHGRIKYPDQQTA